MNSLVYFEGNAISLSKIYQDSTFIHLDEDEDNQLIVKDFYVYASICIQTNKNKTVSIKEEEVELKCLIFNKDIINFDNATRNELDLPIRVLGFTIPKQEKGIYHDFLLRIANILPKRVNKAQRIINDLTLLKAKEEEHFILNYFTSISQIQSTEIAEKINIENSSIFMLIYSLFFNNQNNDTHLAFYSENLSYISKIISRLVCELKSNISILSMSNFIKDNYKQPYINKHYSYFIDLSQEMNEAENKIKLKGKKLTLDNNLFQSLFTNQCNFAICSKESIENIKYKASFNYSSKPANNNILKMFKHLANESNNKINLKYNIPKLSELKNIKGFQSIRTTSKGNVSSYKLLPTNPNYIKIKAKVDNLLLQIKNRISNISSSYLSTAYLDVCNLLFTTISPDMKEEILFLVLNSINDEYLDDTYFTKRFCIQWLEHFSILIAKSQLKIEVSSEDVKLAFNILEDALSNNLINRKERQKQENNEKAEKIQNKNKFVLEKIKQFIKKNKCANNTFNFSAFKQSFSSNINFDRNGKEIDLEDVIAKLNQKGFILKISSEEFKLS